MQPLQLFDPTSSSYSYLLFDEASREALLIDPVEQQLERDLAVLRQYGLRLVWTVETHTHADHITSAAQLAELVGAKTAAPAACGISTASVLLEDGDTLRFGGEALEAMHTPGHTAGSMSYLWRNHVFTGDTLLIDGCGRTDFQSGSATALYHSLKQVLFALPADTLVWPGHDYQGRSHSTIGDERMSNSRVAGLDVQEFATAMAALNLPAPAHLAESVSANQHGGVRQDAGGVSPWVVRPASGYAGDVSPQLAHQWWKAREAVLVDIRTQAERDWVGFVPGAPFVPWKHWPGMVLNPDFDRALLAVATPDKKVLLLCRSGVRSIAAARRATELGLQAYNVLEGFEGDPDEQAHRGREGGWRFHGLPWRQG